MRKATAEQTLRAKAAEVFGSRQAAKTCFNTPAMALDYKRPVELLATPAGVHAVERLLWQLEYGVYI
jgi:putative toxin-antitoxin system antitoxin component (TIGR02293 family)